jgi:tellurite resistance protein TerC
MKHCVQRGQRCKFTPRQPEKDVMSSAFRMTYEVARRIVITVVGITILLIGLLLVFLPGPAIIVIPAGLAILGVEYAWARRWLKLVKARTQKTFDDFKRRRNSSKS